MTSLSQSTIFECCVVTFGCSNAYQKDTCFKRIGLQAKRFVKYSRVNNLHNWKVLVVVYVSDYFELENSLHQHERVVNSIDCFLNLI